MYPVPCIIPYIRCHASYILHHTSYTTHHTSYVIHPSVRPSVHPSIHPSMHFRTFRVAEFVTRLPLLEDRPKARQRCVFKHILPHFRKTHRDGNSSPRHGCPGAGLVTDIADKSRYKHQNETCQHQKHQQESPQSYHP